MIDAETVEEERRRRQAALYPRTTQSDCPDKFRAIAEWWRIDAEESANPDAHHEYAEAQDRLASDMERRHGHYLSKPIDKTTFQWSQVR